MTTIDKDKLSVLKEMRENCQYRDRAEALDYAISIIEQIEGGNYNGID